jgi:oxygen-dependent protoporphyrinogen oxidase
MTTPSPGQPVATTRAAVVAVVGGGITGLTAARRLAQEGLRVILLEGADRLGGQVRTLDLAGRRVDVGAEALHLAAPSARSFVDELGLGESVVGARTGTSWIWTPRGRRPLPAGVGPAGPTRLRPVLSSGVMTLAGLARAGLEPLMALLRRPLDPTDGVDVSVGSFVTGRFGRQVTDRFVDPLLGGLHAGDVNALSLRACAPSLVPAASARRSLVIRRRPSTPPSAGATPIMFASWAGGLSTLTEALLQDVDVEVRLGSRVNALSRSGEGYLLDVEGAPAVSVDALVLAIPSSAAAGLLEPHAPGAAEPLRRQRTARIATVVLGFPRDLVAHLPALAGNGILVPSSTGTLLKAVTHLSTKWPHLDGGDTYLLRVSAGRDGSDELEGLDDDALVARLLVDLSRFTGIEAEPTLVHVQRWPTGLPQLHVGHLERLHAVRAELAQRLPGVQLAGAAYEGVGLTSCITSAQTAADAVLTALRERPAP